MTVDVELLMRYADDELDAAARATVEAAIATNPALAAQVAAFRRQRTRLQRAFAPMLEEPVPERLLAALAPTSRDQAAGKGR